MGRFFLKIMLPSILSIILFILTIFLIIIPSFQQNIMNGKREMIKELTNSALSILAKYENDETKGNLTREEAQNTAVSRIQYLRYGEENKDYFWITDMQPKMIIHPYRTDLNGKDLTNFSDPHGKKLFVEFVNTVRESEQGYVDYMWQWKDDSLHIVPKLSYVRVFKPWGWVIGTGIYIEDVKKEISALTKKLTWISVGISFLIAFFLLFISQQSLKIERRRVKAENDLHESKEKYKTLVEAATEGLIMLFDGKISFSNNVINKLLGYRDSELINVRLIDLISENNNKEIIELFSYNSIKQGQYEINLKKKTGGFIEVLVTSSNALFTGKEVNIIIVKDISVDKNLNLSVLEYQKLLNILNIGFFRADIDAKGKFIFANDTAIRIFGYSDFRELSESNISKMLSVQDEMKNLRKNLLESGYIKNKVLSIHRKNNETALVSVTLVSYNNENNEELICDGLIEDITAQENEKLITKNLIAELKSNSFLIEQPVKNFISQLITLDSDSTIREAINILSNRKSDYLLLTKNNQDIIGIITARDIQNRVLALELNLDNPAYLIMSSPVVYLNENTSVFDSIDICEGKNINHPVIRNGFNDITGVLKIEELYKNLKNSLSFFISDVKKAETIEDLKKYYRKLQLFIKPLIKSDISVSHITKIVSSFSDEVTKKIIELTIKEIGTPPARFSFINLGSEGRKEPTLFTDQDNAIIFEDVPEDKERFAAEYFLKMGEKICNSLDYIGYSFCKGNIMAKNRQWCQPFSVWEKYFTDWITTPEPKNLLDATIFFDFRIVSGEEEFTDNLRNIISVLIKKHSIFLYHLAYNTYNLKLQHISSGNIISDKNTELIDLKNAVNPLIMFVRTYSLQNTISYTNTLERLNALKSKKILSGNTADEIIFAYNLLMKLRFKNQIELSDSNLPLSNTMNLNKLTGIEFSLLKKTLSLIPVYQNKLSVDFRIST